MCCPGVELTGLVPLEIMVDVIHQPNGSIRGGVRPQFVSVDSVVGVEIKRIANGDFHSISGGYGLVYGCS